jgi:lipopolysaccharide transport system ATP-binding protein
MVEKMKKDTRIRNKVKMNDFNHSTSQQLNNLASQQLNTSTSDGVAIRVEHVSKKYCKSLKRSMLYGVTDIGRNTLGLSSHAENLRKHEFWAVDDVSFELKKGETLGIIGPNGSGKTTLLKMLNGIFWPDKGKITIRGRVGALIAVGAGFHPLLTGRENIYINGAILGMTKEEVDEKFDDILKFADIGDFLDAPVKFYSSGMFVRLGFAIAVHCEPDVLLVDEVLSVGDMNFQKKCADKIQEIKKNTSTIFISHSMRQVSRICDRAILLGNGVVEQNGPVDKVVNTYINKNIYRPIGQDDILILESVDAIKTVEVAMYDQDNKETRTLEFGKPVVIKIDIETEENINDVLCSISFISPEGAIVTVINTEESPFSLKIGKNLLECNIKELRLIPGSYYLKIKISSKYGPLLVEADSVTFEVRETQGVPRPMSGYYREKAVWSKVC